VYPGVAVAEALVRRGHQPATLRFVGARRGLEARTGALHGYPLTLLPGRGLARELSARGVVANAKALASSASATALAIHLFSKWRPSVVISLGGYASLACVAAAFTWNSNRAGARGQRPMSQRASRLCPPAFIRVAGSLALRYQNLVEVPAFAFLREQSQGRDTKADR
jgi:Glycosyltransferase family 28 N-terminal domain